MIIELIMLVNWLTKLKGEEIVTVVYSIPSPTLSTKNELDLPSRSC